MDVFLIKTLQLILSISLLVVLHEFGHFFFAKIFGIRVHRFALFFDFWKGGKKALRLGKWGGTDFVIGWLPFGGYVEIAGMVDESSNAEAVAAEEKQIPAHELFKNKPAWQRLLVMVGGVLVNFLVALFIYAMILFTWGSERLPMQNIKHGFSFSPTAQEMGFRNGDLIVGTDSKTYAYFDQGEILRDLGTARILRVVRQGKEQHISLPENLDLLALLKEQPAFLALTLPAVVDSVLSAEAKSCGLRKGDSILAFNGKAVSTWNEIEVQQLVLQDQIRAAQQAKQVAKLQELRKVQMVVKHQGSTQADTLQLQLSSEGMMGVVKHNVLLDYPTERQTYGFWESFPAGAERAWKVLSNYVSDLRHIFSAEGAKSVGSFGTIGSLFPATWDWTAFWGLTAFISIMLAFMNFLPIPMLDGGYIFLLLIEMITGKRLSDKWLERINTIGFYFVLALMALGIFNDVVRFIF